MRQYHGGPTLRLPARLRRQVSSPAARRAAMAGECALDGRRVPPFIDQRIVVMQFLATLDFLQRVDIDPAIFMLHRLAIWLACMIDVARLVATPPAIDHAPI